MAVLSTSSGVVVVGASGPAQTITLPVGGLTAIDMTLTANCTITVAGDAGGQFAQCFLRLRQGPGGPYTVTYGPNTFGAVGQALSTAAGAVDDFLIYTFDAVSYTVAVVGLSQKNAVGTVPLLRGAAQPAPGAPVVTLTAGNGSVNIAWADTPNGATITAHKLFAGTSLSTIALVGTIATGSPYLDTGLSNGQARYYQLSAVAGGVEGARSAVASATPAAPAANPSSSAKPGAGTLSAVAGDGVVTYTYAEAPGSSGITGHTIYSAATQAGVATARGAPLTLGAGGTFALGVANGTSWWVQVTSSNSQGEGARSNYAWGTPQAATQGTVAIGPDFANSVAGVTPTYGPGGFGGNQAMTSGQVRAAVPVTSGATTFGVWFKALPNSNNIYPLNIFNYQDSGYSNSGRTGLFVHPDGGMQNLIDGSAGPQSGNCSDGAAHLLTVTYFSGHKVQTCMDGVVVKGIGGNGELASGYAFLELNVAAATVFECFVYDGAGPVTDQAEGVRAFTPPAGPLDPNTAGLAGLWLLNGTLASAQRVSTGPAPQPAQGTAPTPPVDAQGRLLPGLYLPDTIYVGSPVQYGADINNRVAYALVRGMSAPPTFSFSPGFPSQPDGQNDLYWVGNTLLSYGNPATTVTQTVTVTDGTPAGTFSKTINIIPSKTCVTLDRPWFITSGPAGPYSDKIYVSGVFRYGNNADVSLTDPSGLFSYKDGYLYFKDAASIPTNIGWHTITWNIPTSSGIVRQDQQVLVAGDEADPLAIFTASPFLRDNVPPLVNADTAPDAAPSLLGTISAYADTGVVAITFPDDATLGGGPSGNVYAVQPQTAGTKTVSMAVTSGYGRVKTLPVTITIPAGTNLPPSKMAVTLTPNLDNTVGTIKPGPFLVATVSMAAADMPNPTWTAMRQLADGSNESPYRDDDKVLHSTFAISPNPSDPTKASVYANFLSAGAQTLVITALQGSTQCVSTLALAVADARASGPVITVVPGAAATSTTVPFANDALDVFYAAQTAGTIKLPGGPLASAQYSPYDDKGRPDFTYNSPGNSGHFNGPGPLTITGPDDLSNPTVLQFYGTRGISLSGIAAMGTDTTLRNLVIGHVVNGNNAGAVNKIGGNPGNLVMVGVRTYNSDNGSFAGTNEVSTIHSDRCTYAYCGTGDYGHTHNSYLGHIEYAKVDNLTSMCVMGGHQLKIRARKSDITGGIMGDGQNGSGSNVINLPVGGMHSIKNTVLQKGPYPANNPNFINFGDESTGVNGPGHGTNILTVDGAVFLNCIAPGALTTDTVGIAGVNETVTSPLTSKPCTVILQNCLFWRLPKSGWSDRFIKYIDGGNNKYLTTWPGLQFIDPATGRKMADALKPDARYFSTDARGLYLDALEVSTVVDTSTAKVGDAVTQFFSYCHSPTDQPPLTNQVFSYDTNDGNFTVDAATGILRLATLNPTGPEVTAGSGILFPTVKCVGTDHDGAQQTFYKTIYVILNSGYVPGRDVAGGAITQA